jgi:hypothetical protein
VYTSSMFKKELGLLTIDGFPSGDRNIDKESYYKRQLLSINDALTKKNGNWSC